MNRNPTFSPGPSTRMPHVCGDELEDEAREFMRLRMPHVCGDEPFRTEYEAAIEEYAPRMWG